MRCADAASARPRYRWLVTRGAVSVAVVEEVEKTLRWEPLSETCPGESCDGRVQAVEPAVARSHTVAMHATSSAEGGP